MHEDFQNTGYLLQNLMENMPDNIYFKDADSRFIMVNKAFCEWAGLAPENLIGKSDFDLFAEAHARQAYEDEQRIIRTGEPLLNAEEKETWPDGRITWVSTTKMPLINGDGDIIGTFGISRDITDHKETELRAAYYDEQMRGIKARMEEDIHMASDLQKTFFPQTYPAFRAAGSDSESAVEFLHHYRASGIVSGDFCAIRQLSETEAGIFLCDVMGHGIRAALGTALICVMVEELSDVENDPGAYLDRMNKLLLPILRQGDMFLYATACYLVFDAASGRLRYANAGHPVPLLFPSGGGSAQWLMDDEALRGPALAITQDAEYRTQERTVQPGASVVMYTDGLYELESSEGEEFGEERLLAEANRSGGRSLEELFHSLLGTADAFVGERGLNDDVCMVGLTYHRTM